MGGQIAGVFAFYLFLYVGGVFYTLDFNPLNWTLLFIPVGRTVLGLVTVVLLVMTLRNVFSFFKKRRLLRKYGDDVI